MGNLLTNFGVSGSLRSRRLYTKFEGQGQSADQQQEGDRTSTAKEANTLSKRLEFVPAYLQSELRVDEDCRGGR